MSSNSANSVLKILPNGIHMIPAGDIPPNPTELLSTARMEQELSDLAHDYDYIILDTPPVCPVTDAVILSKMATHVLMLVRENYTADEYLDFSMRQFELNHVDISGFIMNDVSIDNREKWGSMNITTSSDETLGEEI